MCSKMHSSEPGELLGDGPEMTGHSVVTLGESLDILGH